MSNATNKSNSCVKLLKTSKLRTETCVRRNCQIDLIIHQQRSIFLFLSHTHTASLLDREEVGSEQGTGDADSRVSRCRLYIAYDGYSSSHLVQR